MRRSPAIERLSIRATAVFATLALTLAMAAASLLTPAQSLARTRRGECAIRTSLSAHEARLCRRVRRHVVKRRARHAGPSPVPAGASPQGEPAQSAPVAPTTCEDGLAPTPLSGGGFSCADGSTPSCAGGSSAVPAASGSGYVCTAPPEGESASSGAACEEQLEACEVEGEIEIEGKVESESEEEIPD